MPVNHLRKNKFSSTFARVLHGLKRLRDCIIKQLVRCQVKKTSEQEATGQLAAVLIQASRGQQCQQRKWQWLEVF